MRTSSALTFARSNQARLIGQGQRTSRGVGWRLVRCPRVSGAYSQSVPFMKPELPPALRCAGGLTRLAAQGMIGVHWVEFGAVVVVPSGHLAQVGAFVLVPGTLMKKVTGHSW